MVSPVGGALNFPLPSSPTPSGGSVAPTEGAYDPLLWGYRLDFGSANLSLSPASLRIGVWVRRLQSDNGPPNAILSCG